MWEKERESGKESGNWKNWKYGNLKTKMGKYQENWNFEKY